MHTHPLVSIIIPTHNRQAQLLRLIESILRSTYPEESLEIIVVDDVSSDGTGEALKARYGGLVRLIRNQSNLFAAGSRNVGLKVARGQYAFLLDDDNVIDERAIEELVSVLESDPKIGLLGPLMLNYARDQQIWCAGGKLNSLGLPYHLFGGQMLSEFQLPPVISDLDYLPNAFVLRRELIDQGIVHNPRLFPHNWSEQDLGLRVKRAGFTIKTATLARVWHDYGYQSYTTRIGVTATYDQARSRLLFRRLNQDSWLKWLLFWLLVFPISTAYYLWLFLRRPRAEWWQLIKAYGRGTRDGLKINLNV